MVTETTNLKLKKPDGTDVVDISVLNGNMDILDKAVSDKAEKTDLDGKLDKSGGTLTGPMTLETGDGNGIIIPPGGTINDTAGGTLIGRLGDDFQVGYSSYKTVLRGAGIHPQTPIHINGGDGQGLLIPLDGNMNVEGTSNTVLGFLGDSFTIGNGAYGLNVRGSGARPQYNSSDLAMLSDVPSIAGLATEEYVNGKVSSVYKVQGSCTTAELASKAKTTGDVWNLTDAGQYGPAGTNVVYNGTEWDALGGTYDLSEFVKKSGGTMTGKLTVGKASIDTNGYLVGTWIQATGTGNLNSTPAEYAVLSNGWIYKRTLEQTKEDLGINAKADKSEIPDISGLATKGEVQTAQSKANSAYNLANGKASQSDLTSLAHRVTALEDIPNANGVSF